LFGPHYDVSCSNAIAPHGIQKTLSQRHEIQRQETLIVGQQDRLLNMRLAEEIDEATFAAKQTELRDRLSNMKLQLDVLDRSHDEYADLASRIFELSQSLTDKWVTADVFEKRQILEIVFLNCVLDDVTLCPTIRKPFDVLAEGLISKNSRGDKTAIELFRHGVTTISEQVPISTKGLASLLPRSNTDSHFTN